MNLAMRILGVAILASVVAGASYGAVQYLDTADVEVEQPTSVSLEQPRQAPFTLLAGTEKTVTIPVNNSGAQAVNVTLSSGTESFTFEGQPSVQTVPADQTLPVRGSLLAQAGTVGSHQIDIVATNNATGQTLDTLTVDVTVKQPEPPTLTLTSVLPGVIPGGNASVQISAENPLDVRQESQLTLEGIQGEIQPATITLRANGTAGATAEVQIPQGASDTVTVTVKASAGSATPSSKSLDLPVVAPGEVVADAVYDEITVKPGQQAAVPITIVSNLDQTADINASGEHLARADFGTVESGGAAGGFATLAVPENASSSLTATITLEIGSVTKTVDVQVSTELDGREARNGLQAKVDYVGRLADGAVFDSSLASVVEGPFEKSSDFRARPNPSPITVRLTEGGSGTIPGFYQAVVNMTEGETRTVTLPPKLAYGPARQHENISATTEIDRERPIERSQLTQTAQRSQLPDDLDISDVEEGEVFTYRQTKLLLKKKTDSTVTFERYFEKGETLTLYPSWPNATEVQKKNDTHILLYTTPPKDLGNFTWESGQHKSQWENATTVKRVNQTTIVLQHRPEEGLEYEIRSRRGSSTYLVENVDAADVHVSTPNPNPLAGKTLTFDITLLELEELQQRQRRLPTGR